MLSKNEIEKIVAIAKKSGEIAVNFQKSKNLVISQKLDNSEVTNADIAVSQFINEELTKIFPQIKIICEEGKLRNFDDETFWLIDPIDGTKSFIENKDEFSINISLIKNKKPIFGLIYAPLHQGGRLAYADFEGRIIINEKIVSTKKNDSNFLRIISSKRTKDDEIKNFIAQNYPSFIEKYSVKKISSAIKFIYLLENEADLFLALKPTMEWDSAAGQALIEKSFGFVKMVKNNLITDDLFYKKPNFINPSFIAFLK